MAQRRGALIVLEGVDRAGKSSQAKKLVNYLNQKTPSSAKYLNFPNRSTPIGQLINAYLTNHTNVEDHVVHLLFSANRWEALESMKQDLQKGITLIVDRYSYSGVAFSAAKGLDQKWCQNPEMGLLVPDLVLMLDLTPEQAAERSDYGNERYETQQVQTKVREIFHEMANKRNDLWHVLDASPSFDKVHQEICRIVETKLSQKENLIKDLF